MQFLSNGDFGFPFTWPLFLAKQFFVWSYQTGAVNADGIMRMPGRLLDLVVFVVFGNLGFEYFYIFTSLVIVFCSFFYFAYKFLEVKNPYTLLLGSSFYTLNPIFLGNLSKIGLVLAAAMLPLCLVMVREVFEQRRFRYLFIWLLLLNISLIHPFTFTVNFVVSGAYLAHQAWLHRSFAVKSLPKFTLVAGLFILLCAYFLLPLASMHTIDKSSLSDTLTSTPTDYTALVNVLNTGDIFTGLSLSKNVVKDYNFYNITYVNFYFLGAFGFYALLLALYLRVEKRLDTTDKRRTIILLAALIALIVLATVTFLHIDKLIKLLINLPGGWAFRSPLKWQLYIPLALFGLFVLFMKYVTARRHRVIVYGLLAVTFVLMNSFVVVDIYKKLLTPRSIQYFGALQQMNLDHQNLLVVSGSQCWTYEQHHPAVITELNQVVNSKNVQVKRVSVDDIDSVNLGSYDRVLGCAGILQPFISKAYDFKLAGTFANNSFQLYTNQSAQPYVYATASAFTLANTRQMGGKYDFAAGNLRSDFNFVTGRPAVSLPTTNMQDAFEDLSAQDIHAGNITTKVSVTRPGQQNAYLKTAGQSLYYSAQDDRLSVATTKKPGYAPVQAGANGAMVLPIHPSKNLSVNYIDPSFRYQNLISNPSFEQGSWQKKVGDCYNYDDEPEISMSIDAYHKSNGHQSLQLESSSHIACTGPAATSVKPGQQYLLSFDYWSRHNDGGYSIDFAGSQTNSISGRLTDQGSGWHNFTKIITVPGGANTMQLRIEAYPDYADEGTGVARFDNFQLLAIPNVTDRFYLVDEPATKLQVPKSVNFSTANPAQTMVQIHHASKPFYLATSESYSPQWRLELTNHNAANSWTPVAKVAAIPSTDHLKLNDSMNGWYIDPTVLCQDNPAGCSRNADGSYDIRMVMEFTPQRWFYVGSVISAATFVGGIAYFVYDTRRDRHKGVRYRLWR